MNDNPEGLYRHAEFDDNGYLNWAVIESKGSDYSPSHVELITRGGYVWAGTKQEAAKLAGHLLQASDADDLTAVGDDK